MTWDPKLATIARVCMALSYDRDWSGLRIYLKGLGADTLADFIVAGRKATESSPAAVAAFEKEIGCSLDEAVARFRQDLIDNPTLPDEEALTADGIPDLTQVTVPISSAIKDWFPNADQADRDQLAFFIAYNVLRLQYTGPRTWEATVDYAG